MAGYYYPGATALGIKARDGIVLAADKRVAYGYLLMSKAGKKVFRVLDRAGVASAGFIADMQTLARTLEAEMRLYELETGLKPRIYSIAKLLSLILYSSKLVPYLVETIVGGVDEEGPHIYVLDPLGAIVEEEYAALGTGAQLAISIVESEYKRSMSVDEARRLALKAVKAAFSRDAVSGDGIDLLLISTSGVKEEFIAV
ncbi:MAG TPA: archaeal proteasome endopeptidase complex subunit beta [Thermofilaceae archaeon]|nr:archaeal proteasome endopeptidase complex subunit beta [Thermofilaceae archaeon]